MRLSNNICHLINQVVIFALGWILLFYSSQQKKLYLILLTVRWLDHIFWANTLSISNQLGFAFKELPGSDLDTPVTNIKTIIIRYFTYPFLLFYNKIAEYFKNSIMKLKLLFIIFITLILSSCGGGGNSSSSQYLTRKHP